MPYNLDNFTNGQINEFYTDEIAFSKTNGQKQSENKLEIVQKYNNFNKSGGDWSRFRKALEMFISIYESIKGK